jgi:chemotaxis signal transduction protein
MSTPDKGIDWTSVKERLARCQTTVAAADVASDFRLREVFHERARRLARRGRETPTIGSIVDVLVLRIGEERFGVPLPHVKQAFARVLITPVPGANGALIGIANLNGSLRSVADLGLLLSHSSVRPTATYVLLLSAQDQMLAIGVDALEDVCRIDLGGLAPLETTTKKGIQFITGRTEDGIALLDVGAVICHATECNRRGAKLDLKDTSVG